MIQSPECAARIRETEDHQPGCLSRPRNVQLSDLPSRCSISLFHRPVSSHVRPTAELHGDNPAIMQIDIIINRALPARQTTFSHVSWRRPPRCNHNKSCNDNLHSDYGGVDPNVAHTPIRLGSPSERVTAQLTAQRQHNATMFSLTYILGILHPIRGKVRRPV